MAKKVLLVDDEPDVLAVVKEELTYVPSIKR